MSNISIGCNINTTSPAAELVLTVMLDNVPVFEQAIKESVEFKHELSDDDAEHELKFVMSNKRSEHTKIDSDGNILEDACLIVQDLDFDGIKLGQIVPNQAVYTHDFNGSQEPTSEKFYSHMGCNGTVSLKFTTPVYLWLLEHM
mgnify:CR=1 FL=1